MRLMHFESVTTEASSETANRHSDKRRKKSNNETIIKRPKKFEIVFLSPKVIVNRPKLVLTVWFGRRS